MGELIGMVFSRISTIFMVGLLVVGCELNGPRRAPFRPMLVFLVFDALKALLHEPLLARRLPGAGRHRQFLARGRGAPHDAARLQPPHPRAGGVARCRPVRPQHAAGQADRGRRMVSRRGAGTAGAGGARAGRGAGRSAEASSATLRIAATHALSFTFLPRWLRSARVAARRVGPMQLDVRRAAAVRSADAAEQGPVRAEPRASQGARARWMRSRTGRRAIGEDLLIAGVGAGRRRAAAPSACAATAASAGAGAAVHRGIRAGTHHARRGRPAAGVAARARSSSRRISPRCCARWRSTAGHRVAAAVRRGSPA